MSPRSTRGSGSGLRWCRPRSRGRCRRAAGSWHLLLEDSGRRGCSVCRTELHPVAWVVPYRRDRLSRGGRRGQVTSAAIATAACRLTEPPGERGPQGGAVRLRVLRLPGDVAVRPQQHPGRGGVVAVPGRPRRPGPATARRPRPGAVAVRSSSSGRAARVSSASRPPVHGEVGCPACPCRRTGCPRPEMRSAMRRTSGRSPQQLAEERAQRGDLAAGADQHGLGRACAS